MDIGWMAVIGQVAEANLWNGRVARAQLKQQRVRACTAWAL